MEEPRHTNYACPYAQRKAIETADSVTPREPFGGRPFGLLGADKLRIARRTLVSSPSSNLQIPTRVAAAVAKLPESIETECLNLPP